MSGERPPPLPYGYGKAAAACLDCFRMGTESRKPRRFRTHTEAKLFDPVENLSCLTLRSAATTPETMKQTKREASFVVDVSQIKLQRT